mgnify:CR=1 FL=1
MIQAQATGYDREPRLEGTAFGGGVCQQALAVPITKLAEDERVGIHRVVVIPGHDSGDSNQQGAVLSHKPVPGPVAIGGYG